MRRALFIRTEGEVGGYAGCSDHAACHALGERYLDSGVASAYEMDPCCRDHTGLICHKDDRDEDLDRRSIILAIGLARAEDRWDVAAELAACLLDTEYRPPGVLAELFGFLRELD